jgi:hypothetical protein
MKYVVALAFAGFVGVGIALSAQRPPCLHGTSETADQLARRRAALQFVRLVNSLEAGRGQTYVQLPDLTEVPMPPEGFSAQLSTDGKTYALSIKDTTDRCLFAYFSDQAGVIYRAAPIQ